MTAEWELRLYDKIFNVLHRADDLTPAVVQAKRIVELAKQDISIQLGRDAIELGIDAFLDRLVGEDNAQRLWERHAGEAS
jgi:hypothetical protein